MFEQIKAVLALRNDERGVTAMEYGLIAALLGTVLIAAVPTLGNAIKAAFIAIAAKLVVT